MYRMAVMAMCTTDVTLDIAKCVMLAVVHDIAEAQGVLCLVSNLILAELNS
jgi:uncharacterized protein Smg (DUF494 family)